MIYIVRHGETDANTTNVIRGSYFDDDLNAVGHAQARETAKQLEGVKFDVCYCSPLKRTLQTCAPIYSGEVIMEKRLLPRDYGKLVELGESPEWLEANGYWNRERDLPVENGESVSQVETRMRNFLDDIKQKHAGQNVLVVTHGSIMAVINAIMADFKHGDECHQYRVKNCAVLEVPN